MAAALDRKRIERRGEYLDRIFSKRRRRGRKKEEMPQKRFDRERIFNFFLSSSSF